MFPTGLDIYDACTLELDYIRAGVWTALQYVRAENPSLSPTQALRAAKRERANHAAHCVVKAINLALASDNEDDRYAYSMSAKRFISVVRRLTA